MTTTAPTNVRVVHVDGTEEPISVQFIGKEPRIVKGDVRIIEVWESTTVLAWRDGDRIEFDWPAETSGSIAIRSHRVGGDRW